MKGSKIAKGEERNEYFINIFDVGNQYRRCHPFFVILYLVIKTAVKKGMIEAHREIHSTNQEQPYE